MEGLKRIYTDKDVRFLLQKRRIIVRLNFISYFNDISTILSAIQTKDN